MSGTIKVGYEFSFADGTAQSYDVEIDKETLLLTQPPPNPPEWTKLENKKCGHCPLKSQDFLHCPAAANISSLVEAFKNKISFTETSVTVTTAERTYFKRVSLQQGVFSIFGLLMATSPCPSMAFLRPMARYHLPFANSEETIVRSVSMYLLRQYFVAKRGGQPDLNLVQLENHYNDIQKVNMGMIARIRGLNAGDSDVNAITILQSIASLLTMAISKDLSRIETLFRS